ncbi:uncharacterized protein B0H18DRAFT_873330 [Fomitopsis serialis]|uniref:uncharacterized protein n=1 Tax=Fomitopsis serialis TaxID=139415 RepID=UPI0020081D75|nr:uncharacterized protein B0H18DRAFT_873330 [Neoantrodia serialis]KAH9930239.1 hypothetical protein B0H18DRAFT_873330 [Neoantrodia serialis]
MTLPDTDSIIFYDIPSSVPGSAWSPNTWKTRFALNYKGIPYRTEWVEYTEIASLLTSLGVEASPSPISFTLPAIYDPRTGTAMMDSLKIARYLDETYPDTPVLLPPDTRVFQHAFQDALLSAVHMKLIPLLICACVTKLNPPSEAYFREAREVTFGCTVEELSPPEKRPEQWDAVEKGFGVLASWVETAGDDRLLLTGGGPAGDASRVRHADISIAGLLIWVRAIYGEESEEWRRVKSFDGGRWKRFLDFFEQWADTSR